MQLRSGLAGSRVCPVPPRIAARRAVPRGGTSPLPRRAPPRRLLAPLAAAVGAAWPCNGAASNGVVNGAVPDKGDGLDELLRGPGAAYHPPAPLPPTPTAATLAALMPYLAKLALGERQLVWRVTGALMALLL